MHLIFRTVATLLKSRRRSRVSLWEPTSVPLRALLTDVDIAWHINNGQYFGLFDLGRFDLMDRCGLWKESRKRGWLPVVQAEQIAFRRSVEFGQKFSVETRFLGFDERSMWLEQRIVVDGEVYVRGYICGRLRAKDGRPVSNEEIADAVRSLGHDPEGGPGIPEWLHEWRRNIALPSSRTPVPHTW
ncbi:4-hydroxybenzoyl-CoA thioesterase [Micrococcus sp. HMSC067E09]|uniref:acyl-CoA thioesterase n=1 Tax=Micrococcus TaxID=1269 RepID=UPI0008A3FF43|nr:MULTISPECIES: acyl-CoA thioesterase [Micrococcus]OFR88562.1 4-hydroxybenzoyl-CoA thioesterase [Micrococcus sp. HMSC067E09]WIK81411.1 acyl-CoA thioesterase [Micrococcus lylae]